jgi:hypothetical protein
MSNLFLTGVGLVCIFEGILPFVAPRFWRRMMQNMIMQGDKALHIFGFVSMIIGLIILYLSR